MIDDLKPQDVLFLKHIRDKVLVKYNLPTSCMSIEFMNVYVDYRPKNKNLLHLI